MVPKSALSATGLPGPARRHIRVYQIHQFLDRFAMGLTVSVVALALSDRGMDLFQISILFGMYSLTAMAMELPFGGLADNIGRKPVFLAAVIASMVSLALFLSTSVFPVLALSFAFIGFGRALRSGTLDAWFVETFQSAAPNVDIQPALARAQWANAMGLAMGAVVGGLLPDIFGPAAVRLGFSIYDVSYAVSLAVMIAVFAYTLLAIVETPRPRNALTQGFTTVPQVIRDAALLARKTPALSMLLAALALFLMASNPIEVLWPTHLKPMLAEGKANTIIGVLTAVYFFSIAFGAALSSYINRLFNQRHAITLSVAFAYMTGIQIALALQGHVVGFVLVFILYSVALGVAETPASSILHRYADDRQRSTILSLRSLIQQLGAALGLVVAGAIAEISSTPAAWLVGAAFLFIATTLITLLDRQLSTARA
jgi:MFS family permease